MSTSTRPVAAGRKGLGPWRWAAIIFAIATVLGLAASLQIHYTQILAGYDASLRENLVYWLPDWYVWAALTPLILWLGRRIPPERSPYAPKVVFHVFAGAFFGATELLLSCSVIAVIAGVPPTYSGVWDYFTSVLPRYSVWGFALYSMILAAGRTYDSLVALRERELTVSRLRERLARSELRALRMQLQPHFLFNALHSVGSLVRKGDRRDALAVLEGLGDLLRYSLENVGRQTVSLREELEFVGRYLEIQQIRFRDRLEVDYRVDPRTLRAEIPNLILQPLVENAIRHAVAPFAAARTLTVRAERAGDRLRLAVEDDGPGPEPIEGAERENGSGIGVRNIRERLELLYGEESEFRLAARESGGTRASLTLPFRSAPPDDDSRAEEMAPRRKAV